LRLSVSGLAINESKGSSVDRPEIGEGQIFCERFQQFK
jgi:hypothetical protein